MNNHAIIQTGSARLASAFGHGMALRFFGEDKISAMPRYVRGPKKGHPKGDICWRKVERGGWVSNGPASDGPNGYVERRVGKIISAHLVTVDYSTGKETIHATFKL